MHRVLGDVSSTESVERLAQQVAKFLKEERGGVPLFGLVNNAGILLPPCSVLNTPESSLKKVMEVLLSLSLFAQHSLYLEKKIQDQYLWDVEDVEVLHISHTNGRERQRMYSKCDLCGGIPHGALRWWLLHVQACRRGKSFLPTTLAVTPQLNSTQHNTTIQAFTDAMRREIRSTGIRVSMIEPYFANTPLLNAFEQRDAKIEGEDKDDIDKALSTLMQHVKLLPAESAANCICESLFTSPVPTRTQVSFWHDTILIFLLTKVLPDTWMDCILPILLAIGKPKEK